MNNLIDLGGSLQKQPKKGIIVIGKMGHGKSSFVKMLACPKDRPTIHLLLRFLSKL